MMSLSKTLHHPEQVDKNKEEFFSAWNSCLHHVTGLALAHIHRGNTSHQVLLWGFVEVTLVTFMFAT